jgi:hypothetical protein
MQAGISAGEIQQRFGARGWDVISARRLARETIPPLRLRAETVAARFGLWAYRMQRRPNDASAG